MKSGKNHLSLSFLDKHLKDRLAEPLLLNLISCFVHLFGGYRRKIDFDLITPRSSAFGILRAADLAKELGVRKIYAIEFGVAAGAGLLGMARIARSVSEVTGVDVEVVGFDTGEGLPPARDYRDHPEYYQTGDFPPIDKEKLVSSLPSNAKIMYGNITDTVKDFPKLAGYGVIGFIHLDVDYYWSSMECLKLLEHEPELCLPVMPLYLDDVGHESHNPWCGELLAVNEFNAAHRWRKIAPYTGLRNNRIMKHAFWIDQMYALHVLDHPTRTVKPERNREAHLLTNPYL